MTPGLYFSHPACLEHDPRVHAPGPPRHARAPAGDRAALADRDWLGWERREAPAATEAQLELVHSARHVRAIMDLCAAGGGAIDADTFVGESSFRAASRGRRRVLDDPRAAGRRRSGRVLRRAALRPPRRARARDGLLPVQQRRGRRRAGDRRARRPQGVRPGLGRPPRQRHRGGVPAPPGRAVREHPPGGAVSRHGPARATPARARARATRSTCRCPRDPKRSCGCRCSSTSCCRRPSRSSPIWC